MAVLTLECQTNDRRAEVRAIGNAISIGAAAGKLGINPHYCKGLIDGLGIRPTRIGRMRVITARDFRRLRRLARKDAAGDLKVVMRQ